MKKTQQKKPCKHVVDRGVAYLIRPENPSLEELKERLKTWGYVIKRIPECRGIHHDYLLASPSIEETLAILEQLGFSATKKPAKAAAAASGKIQ
jgi:signal recognition particle subunit SEC65